MGGVTTPRGPTAPEPLSTEHNLVSFDSGVVALDAWLKERARANQAAGASRTFAACERGRVAGYYSLAAASIMRSQATNKAKRNMPDPVRPFSSAGSRLTRHGGAEATAPAFCK